MIFLTFFVRINCNESIESEERAQQDYHFLFFKKCFFDVQMHYLSYYGAKLHQK